MRYMLQRKYSEVGGWLDTNIFLNTKADLDSFIGDYHSSYEWRCGYTFKKYDYPLARFVWNSGKKKGQEVKV